MIRLGSSPQEVKKELPDETERFLEIDDDVQALLRKGFEARFAKVFCEPTIFQILAPHSEWGSKNGETPIKKHGLFLFLVSSYTNPKSGYIHYCLCATMFAAISCICHENFPREGYYRMQLGHLVLCEFTCHF